MANYREIVTKAVISKGKKLFNKDYSVSSNNDVSTILGVWVINHKFSGEKVGNEIRISGSYDVNIWYSYDNDTKTVEGLSTSTLLIVEKSLLPFDITALVTISL